jgi:excisionase family DNA binding protein
MVVARREHWSQPPVYSDVVPLLTPAELGDYLGVPLGTLANWRYQGRGPAYVRFGRHVRYRATDIAAWVDEQQPRRRAGRSPSAGTATPYHDGALDG